MVKNRLLDLFLHILLVGALVFFTIFIYFEIKNIFLSYFIIILSTILFISKLINWKIIENLKHYKIKSNNYFNWLLTSILTYFVPVYCIVQEPHLIVNRYISILSLIIITILAIIGILIDKEIFIKNFKIKNYDEKTL